MAETGQLSARSVWAGRETLCASALAALFAALAVILFAEPAWAQGDPCAAPANEIVAENCRAGDAGERVGRRRRRDPSIQGFATDISVDQGRP